MTSEYQRILYPERAEYFQDEQAFDSYRIFLDHWSEITTYLQEAYEIHRTRSHSKSLIVYGAQGIGKSILAGKIYKDFEKTKDDLKKNSLVVEKENIWHRISSGRAGGPQVEKISTSAGKTVIVKFESQKNWAEEAAKVTAANKDRSCLVIVDNCERDFFLKGLLNVSDDTYLAHGRSEVAMRQSAHRFVELCRNELRGCLFLFFTNDEHFALTFDQYINAQHSGLSDIRDLKMPSDSAKEVIVRATLNKPSKSTAHTDASRRIDLKSKKRKVSTCKRRFSTAFASGTRNFPDPGRNYPAYRGRVKYRFASASATNARVVFFARPR